jgi:hypothetical protein
LPEVQTGGLRMAKGDTNHVPSSVIALLAHLHGAKLDTIWPRLECDIPTDMTYCQVVEREKAEGLDRCQRVFGLTAMELTCISA